MRNLKGAIGLAAVATLALSAVPVVAQDGEALDICFIHEDLETEFWLAGHKAMTETLAAQGHNVITKYSPDANVQLELGVVEQSPIRRGGSAGEALRETLELAAATEAMGYERFWVAEHHNLPGIASTSPEILIGQIAARTEHMRIGSGGVMLPHYSAFKVAENFRMLEALFPGRIDLRNRR